MVSERFSTSRELLTRPGLQLPGHLGTQSLKLVRGQHLVANLLNQHIEQGCFSDSVSITDSRSMSH